MLFGLFSYAAMSIENWGEGECSGMVITGTLQESLLLMKCLLWVWCLIITFEFAISARLSKLMSCGPNESDLGQFCNYRVIHCKWQSLLVGRLTPAVQ